MADSGICSLASEALDGSKFKKHPFLPLPGREMGQGTPQRKTVTATRVVGDREGMNPPSVWAASGLSAK